MQLELIDQNSYLPTTQRHAKISQLCQEWNSVHKHLDGYEVCSSKKTFHVHNCDAEETVYDKIHDTLFLRCTDHKGVFHLQNATTCLNQNYDIYLEQEYYLNEHYGAYIVIWKGLSCRVNKAKYPERPVL